MARNKEIYRPQRMAHRTGHSEFCTVNLRKEIGKEFQILVKAYSETYGERITPTQIIKRFIDVGLKRCDPDVYETFVNMREEGTVDPVVEITYPTVEEVRIPVLAKKGEVAIRIKQEGDTFIGTWCGRKMTTYELAENGWTLYDKDRIEITDIV